MEQVSLGGREEKSASIEINNLETMGFNQCPPRCHSLFLREIVPRKYNTSALINAFIAGDPEHVPRCREKSHNTCTRISRFAY